ncbi:MAG: glycoside hydrolase family 5 protein [Actinomycetota bacterium]|nr:glycoside hydrolase family 5 protein [Actinomycetota bacterium]
MAPTAAHRCRRHCAARLIVTLLALLCLPGAASAAPGHRGAQLNPRWEGESTVEASRRELDLVRAAGANTVRIGLGWSALEQDGKGRFSDWYVRQVDTFVGQAARRGIGVVVALYGSPCWASTAPAEAKQGCGGAWWERDVQSYPPSDPRDYADAAAWVARRWGTDLVALEIWNEPNISSPEFFRTDDRPGAYAALVRAAYAPIKAAQAELPVLAGALAFADYRFLAALYDRGIGGHHDGVSIHPYDDPELRARYGDDRYSFSAGVPGVRGVMVDRGEAGKPLWLTEFGWPTCARHVFRWCVSREEQAAKLRDAFLTIDGWPFVAGAIVYALRDAGTSSEDFEQNMGLVTHGFEEKPAYGAFRQAMAPRPPAAPSPPAESRSAAPPQGTPIIAPEPPRRAGVVRIRRARLLSPRRLRLSLACRGDRACRTTVEVFVRRSRRSSMVARTRVRLEAGSRTRRLVQLARPARRAELRFRLTATRR